VARRRADRLKPVARGRGYRLCPLRRSDGARLVAVTQASRSFHRPWVDPPISEDAFHVWMGARDAPSRQRFLLYDREGEIAGYFSLGEITGGALKSAYLGYWANAVCARRGAMTEGLELVLRYAFRGVGLHRVEANIQPGNAASLALVERCGFRHEGFSPRYLKVRGRWRDHERWAMTVEDWRELQRSR